MSDTLWRGSARSCTNTLVLFQCIMKLLREIAEEDTARSPENQLDEEEFVSLIFLQTYPFKGKQGF